MIWLFYTTYITVDLAQHEMFHAKVGKCSIKSSIVGTTVWVQIGWSEKKNDKNMCILIILNCCELPSWYNSFRHLARSGQIRWSWYLMHMREVNAQTSLCKHTVSTESCLTANFTFRKFRTVWRIGTKTSLLKTVRFPYGQIRQFWGSNICAQILHPSQF